MATATVSQADGHLVKKLSDDVMAANDRWPYPANKDGWIVAHNALRTDMRIIQSAVDVLAAQLSKGEPLQAWQASNLKKYWHHFQEHVELHHGNEEEIFFPWMQTRVSLPPRFSADHETLMKHMADCAAAVNNLRCSGDARQDAPLLKSFQDAFEIMRPHMEEHLLEEEQVGLPLLRQHFTFKEFKPIETKIVQSMSVDQSAGIFHALEPAARKEFFKQAGIPWLVVKLLIKPAVNRYDRNVAQLMRDIINNTGSDRPQKTGCFGG